MIDISNKDKRAVLIALYEGARAQGLGFLHARSDAMTIDQAEQLMASHGGCFDYVHGRVLKVDLNDDAFDPRLYDRDNGPGAAREATDKVPSL